jgi:GntR family transcriptional regulator
MPIGLGGVVMNLEIDRKSGVPIYIQVKNQIMDDIKNGTLRIGEKMPTERELSQKLNTSRNTISSAYNLLEQEGVLISYQGRGTFVAEEAKTWKQHRKKGKLLKLIDMSFEEALEMGMDSKEFLALAQERIKEKEAFIKDVNAIFIECNVEQANSFAKELGKWTNLNIVPLVLQDLEARNEATEKLLKETELIIATFNHVNEVKALTSELKKDVFGVAINPSLETIVKIARYPRNTKFGLICLSKEFHFKVESALSSAGLENIVIDGTTSRKIEDCQRIINASDVIIVSPGRREEVKKISKGKKEIISFDYNLDQDSVKAIISKIIEIKNHI